jgi:Pyruvate/2-oxoacid:ferredoxin oxidoreductase delta subunit
VENLNGYLSMVCNCCSCCCVFLQTQKTLGLQMISSSSYAAVVDAEACVGCGTCGQRCPMDALLIGDDETAGVDTAKCIGCGVCAPTCPSEAIALVQRNTVTPPPDVMEFFGKRYKAPGAA